MCHNKHLIVLVPKLKKNIRQTIAVVDNETAHETRMYVCGAPPIWTRSHDRHSGWNKHAGTQARSWLWREYRSNKCDFLNRCLAHFISKIELVTSTRNTQADTDCNRLTLCSCVPLNLNHWYLHTVCCMNNLRTNRNKSTPQKHSPVIIQKSQNQIRMKTTTKPNKLEPKRNTTL